MNWFSAASWDRGESYGNYDLSAEFCTMQTARSDSVDNIFKLCLPVKYFWFQPPLAVVLKPFEQLLTHTSLNVLEPSMSNFSIFFSLEFGEEDDLCSEFRYSCLPFYLFVFMFSPERVFLRHSPNMKAGRMVC